MDKRKQRGAAPPGPAPEGEARGASVPVEAAPARPGASSPAPHLSPVRTYALVLAVLLALTAITTWVGYQELGPLNNIVALTIAVTKGVLVVLFFMHARYSS